MKTGFFLLVWSFLSLVAAAQVADTSQAYQHLTQGHKFYQDIRNYDSAAIYYSKAGHAFRSAKFPKRFAYCLNRQGLAAYRNRQLQKAIELFKSSVQIYDSLSTEEILEHAGPYGRLGTTYTAQGNYYQALDYFKRNLAIRVKFEGLEALQTGVAYYNLGTAYMNYGEYQNGMLAYQKALPIYLKHHGEHHRRLSSLYVNMGILYDKGGQAEKALEYYDKSTQIDLTLYGDQYALLAYNYYNMAIAHINLNDFKKGEIFYKKSIDLSEKNQIYHLIATGHYGLGNIAKSKNDLNGAAGYYLKAIHLFTEYFGRDHPDINHSLRALAEVWEKRGVLEKSQKYLDQALGLLHRNYGTAHPFIATTYKQKALLQSGQRQFETALLTMDKAYKALAKNPGESGMTNYEDYSDESIFMDLLRAQASILGDKYEFGGKNLKDLKLALAAFQQAIKVIDQVRRGYMLDDSKLFLQEQAFSTYEMAIACAAELHQVTGDEGYLHLVHGFIEKSKGTVLAEALQGNKLTNIQGVPDSLLHQEMALKQQISYLESSRATAAEETLDSLENQLFVLKRSYDALAQKLATKHPKYYDLKYQVAVAEVTEIQENLAASTGVLNYFLGDQQWYVFAITKEDISLHVIDSATYKKLDIQKFRDLITSEQTSKFRESSLPYRFYEALILQPTRTWTTPVTNLVIVPHGPLGHIPFDAFVTSQLSERTIPYLVYEYAISYTLSMTLLQQAQSLNRSQEPYRGFAPVYQDTNQDLPELRGSLAEVGFARSLFQGQQFLADQATEDTFKVTPSGAQILHLAMHALIDDQDPMNSRLMFSRDSTSLEDGSLFAHEIYDLDLSSQLAVLSACNTGYGEISRGEGIMNLSRAFQFAGSPNIIMSLWQAKDQPTSAIMAFFFENIKAGLPKDVALQKAKLSYLSQADPFQAHPSQWATFVFLGQTHPLEFSGNYWKWALLSGSFLLLILWFMKQHKLRRKTK